MKLTFFYKREGCQKRYLCYKNRIKSTLVTVEILPEQSSTTVIRSVVIVFFWGPLFLVLIASGQWLHVILSHSILCGCCVAVRLSLRLLPSLIKQLSVKMKRKAKKKARFDSDSENIQSACFLFDKSELLLRQSPPTSAL